MTVPTWAVALGLLGIISTFGGLLLLMALVIHSIREERRADAWRSRHGQPPKKGNGVVFDGTFAREAHRR